MEIENVTIGALKKAVDFFQFMQEKFNATGQQNVSDMNHIALTTMKNMVSLYETRDYAIVPIELLSSAPPGKRIAIVLDETNSPCEFLPVKDQ